MRIFDNGYLAPIVDMHLQYKQPVTIDDIIIIETTYIPSLAAKMMFEYNIYRKSDHALVLKASTIQLFKTKDGAFEISTPPFLAEWRQKWNNDAKRELLQNNRKDETRKRDTFSDRTQRFARGLQRPFSWHACLSRRM
jgi:hypothetical protein